MQTTEEAEHPIAGGVWPLDSPAETPEIEVESWEVHEVQLPGRSERTHHLLGLRGWHREGVVSSAITDVEATASRFTTESGRVYVVRGSTGGNLDSEYVWNHWLRINGATGADNVTAEVVELLTISVVDWQIVEHPRPSDPRRKTLQVCGTVLGTVTAYACDVERFNRTTMTGIDRSGRFFKLFGACK